MEKITPISKSSHLSKQIDLNNWLEVDTWSKLLNCSVDTIFDAAINTDGSFGEISKYICGILNN